MGNAINQTIDQALENADICPIHYQKKRTVQDFEEGSVLRCPKCENNGSKQRNKRLSSYKGEFRAAQELLELQNRPGKCTSEGEKIGKEILEQ